MRSHNFFIVQCNDVMIFKYVLQVMLAFSEKVVARSPLFSDERKTRVK